MKKDELYVGDIRLADTTCCYIQKEEYHNLCKTGTIVLKNALLLHVFDSCTFTPFYTIINNVSDEKVLEKILKMDKADGQLLICPDMERGHRYVDGESIKPINFKNLNNNDKSLLTYTISNMKIGKYIFHFARNVDCKKCRRFIKRR